MSPRPPKSRSKWEDRRRFIMGRLGLFGRIRPKDIMDEFPVTRITAQADIRGLRAAVPGMLIFRYEGSSGWWYLTSEYEKAA